MKAEDIAKALKCCYAPEGNGSCDGCPYGGDEGLCYGLNIEYHAGEIIESLLSQLEATIAGQETLQKALSESQRREQAAVEDIRISHINMCAICKYEESAPEDGCAVNSNGNCDFVWRGPVED